MKRMSLAVGTAVLVLSGSIAGCASSSQASQGSGGTNQVQTPPPNTDPHKGWINIGDSPSKQPYYHLQMMCNGTTALYHDEWSGSLTASPHDDACAAPHGNP